MRAPTSANPAMPNIRAAALRSLKSYSQLLLRAGTVRAHIAHALEVALEWIAVVPIALIAVAVMLLAAVLYSIIWVVRRLLEGL